MLFYPLHQNTELCIKILVFVALTLNQGHRSARKQKHLVSLSHKVFTGFGLSLIYCQDLLI